MRGDAESPASARLAFAPIRLLAGHFEHAPQPPAVDRIFVEGRAVIRILDALGLEIDHLARPEQIEQELEGVASGRLCHLVCEAVRGEGVEVVAYRAEPADPN